MPIQEQTIIDKIELVGEFRHIQVRQVTQFVDSVSGEVLGQKRPLRSVVMSDDDTKANSFGQEIADLANLMWTPAIRAKWKAKQNAQNP